MRVRFWGTRGSIPAPINGAAVRAKLRAALIKARGLDLPTDAAIDRFIDNNLTFAERSTFGGNSPCVELDVGGPVKFLCDLGTGARVFGARLLADHGPQTRHAINVFMSHVHWDHIMGFPFLAQAYIRGNHIRIHGVHDELEEAFRRQHRAPSFPVPFDALGADIEFVRLRTDQATTIDGVTVRILEQHHEGRSFAYRFEHGGKAVVYSTDSEHKAGALGLDYPFVRFFADADLVIFDAMYSLAESVSVKEDWGHSSNMVGVELCHMARAKRLCLFHHEPVLDDAGLEAILKETIRFEEISQEGAGLTVISAYDGLELEL